MGRGVHIEERRGMGGSWQTFDPTPAAGIEPCSHQRRARSSTCAICSKPFLKMESVGRRLQLAAASSYVRRSQPSLRPHATRGGHQARASRQAARALRFSRRSHSDCSSAFTRFGHDDGRADEKLSDTQPLLEKRLETAAALYRALDGAMTLQGIGLTGFIAAAEIRQKISRRKSSARAGSFVTDQRVSRRAIRRRRAERSDGARLRTTRTRAAIRQA